MRFYVNISIPSPLLERVQAFERKWQGTSRSDPHITVVMPRELKKSATQEQLIGVFGEAIESDRQFPIVVSGVGYFADKSHIYAGVVRSPELVLCNKALMTSFDNIALPGDGRFTDIPTPHITLASHLTPEKQEEAWREAQAENWDTTFPCTNLQLLGMIPGDIRWTILAAFHLL